MMGAGVSKEIAREEVDKIHSENIELLEKTSEKDLMAERKRVEQVLGPELVAFLKRRTRGSHVEKMDEEGERDVIERERTGVVAPEGWLNMEEVEKDKMEWMTDVQPTEIKV